MEPMLHLSVVQHKGAPLLPSVLSAVPCIKPGPLYGCIAKDTLGLGAINLDAHTVEDTSRSWHCAGYHTCIVGVLVCLHEMCKTDVWCVVGIAWGHLYWCKLALVPIL